MCMGEEVMVRRNKNIMLAVVGRMYQMQENRKGGRGFVSFVYKEPTIVIKEE